jgi:hypothetical protein
LYAVLLFCRDYGSCPVDEEISSPEELDGAVIATMTTNLRGVLDRYAQYKKDIGHPVKINGFHKNVFAPQGNTFKNIDRIPPTWGAFTKNDYKVHHYSKKCSAEQLMRNVLEGLLKAHRPSTDLLVLCFVTNDPEFSSIAAFLKLESQNDMLLVHSSAQNSITSLVKKHYSWTQVQDLARNRKDKKKDKAGSGKDTSAKTATPTSSKAKETPVEKERSSRAARYSDLESGEEQDDEDDDDDDGDDGEGLRIIPPGRELVPWNADGGEGFDFGIEEDPELQEKGKKAKKSLATLSADSDEGDSNKASRAKGGDGNAVVKLDLRFSSIATYMKKLLSWRRAQDEAQGGGSFNYLMGEDTSGYEEDPATACFLRVDMNPKVKKFFLHIRGPSAALVEQRHQRIKQMVDECIKVRQLHSFTGWSAEHRAALIGSEVLAAQEKATRACVLFHYSGATTVAEIVALRAVQHNALLKFVQKLKPKETLIEIPAAFVCWYDDQMWEKMRSCFAVKTEVIGADGKPAKVKTGYISPEEADETVKLKVWGFMPKFLEKALEHIHLNDDRAEISVVQWVDEAASAAAAAAMNAAANPTSAKGSGKDKDGKKDKEKEREKEREDKPAGRTVVMAPLAAPTASAVTAALRGETPTAGLVTPTLSAKSPKDRGADETAAGGLKAVCTFVDREGARFFYTFEDVFLEYLDRVFGVFVDEKEHALQLNLMNSNPDVRLDQLKVALYGSSMKSIQAARAYMDQFNDNALGRCQIFFPRVSARKFKDISNKKAAQVQKMLQLRIKNTAVDITAPRPERAPIDPFTVPGFVNIRSVPLMHNNAKVTFPTDVTITVCASLASDATRSVLDENKAAFNSIPSEFPIASLAVPATHSMRAALMTKAERDELAKRFNLVALRWEEASRTNGNMAVLRVWAYTKANLKTFVAELSRPDLGGSQSMLFVEDDTNVKAAIQTPPAGMPVPAPVPQPMPPRPTPAPVLKASPVMRPVQVPPPAAMMGQHNNGIHGAPQQMHGLQAGNAKIFANAKGAIRPVPGDPRTPPVEAVLTTKNVIYLPDLSLRFVMQGEPLKTKLGDVLERLLKSGVHIAYPYKDRTDPHACFELEGERDSVGRASVELNEFIEKATRSLRCVQVIMNTEQFHYLTAGGEGLLTGSNVVVQEMQTSCGVHFIFNPPPTSTREAFSLFDMRFASELVRKDALDQFGVAEPSFEAPGVAGKVDKEMMSVSVYNMYSQRSVEISIISSNSSESGWTWGVNNLLLLVGSNTLGFSAVETDLLNRGEVLVQRDANTGKTILRIKPNGLTRGINFQAAVLTNALLKCLQKANELGLKGLAVSAPTDIDAFPELTPELIRSLTVEAVVEFAKKCRSYLRFTKLVCIELGNNVATQAALLETSATPHIPAAMAALERRIEPTQRDRMVRTMAVLLERQEAEQVDVTLQAGYDPRNPHAPMQQRPPQSRISLLTCNVPLPLSLFTSLPSYERPKGFKTFLIKGLLSSVVKAVDLIRAKLATPKPMDDLPFNVEEFF